MLTFEFEFNHRYRSQLTMANRKIFLNSLISSHKSGGKCILLSCFIWIYFRVNKVRRFIINRQLTLFYCWTDALLITYPLTDAGKFLLFIDCYIKIAILIITVFHSVETFDSFYSAVYFTAIKYSAFILKCIATGAQKACYASSDKY